MQETRACIKLGPGNRFSLLANTLVRKLCVSGGSNEKKKKMMDPKKITITWKHYCELNIYRNGIESHNRSCTSGQSIRIIYHNSWSLSRSVTIPEFFFSITHIIEKKKNKNSFVRPTNTIRIIKTSYLTKFNPTLNINNSEIHFWYEYINRQH